jgi:hypothetical protein
LLISNVKVPMLQLFLLENYQRSSYCWRIGKRRYFMKLSIWERYVLWITILTSVKKTNRLVVLEGLAFCSVASEITYIVQERALIS